MFFPCALAMDLHTVVVLRSIFSFASEQQAHFYTGPIEKLTPSGIVKRLT